MSFEDLQRALKEFFRTTPAAPADIRTRVKFRTMAQYRAQNRPWWWLVVRALKRHTRVLVPSVLMLTVALGGWIGSIDTHAGEITPTRKGLIEINRNGDVRIVTNTTRLRPGDVVTLSNAEAEVRFPDQMISTAGARTEFRVLDDGRLFLTRGALENVAKNNESEIATSRGRVRPIPGAKFALTVSESGETRVVLHEQSVTVLDHFDHEKRLAAGDELRLHTDTRLSGKTLPSDLRLSSTQLNAIDAKLLIARSKVLGGLEKMRDGEFNVTADFISAERTFRSIAQVLQSSRDLKILNRKNLSLVDNSEVFAMASQKTSDADLLREIRATEVLLRLVLEPQSPLLVTGRASGSRDFDRFSILVQMFAKLPAEEQALGEVLQQRSVVNFVRAVLDEEMKMDQVAVLNKQVDALPKTPLARNFLRRSEQVLSPELAEMLDEKIRYLF